jgi:hypothetical protein
MDRLPSGLDRGEFPHAPPPPSQTAAELFLGDHAEAAARQMSDEWRKAIAPHWAMRHEKTKKLAAELAELDQYNATPPGVEELWIKARKLMELHDDAAAAPVLDQVLALNPTHAGANFVRGRLYLENDDLRGITLMEAALEADPMLTPDGCNLLYGLFARTGQRDRLRPWEDRVGRFHEEAVLAQRERSNVSAYDTFMAHDLALGQLAALQKVFQSEPDIGTAAVVRRQVQHFPQNLAFVVALRVSASRWKPRRSGTNQALVNRVVRMMELPGQFLVIVEEKNLTSVARRIFAQPGATVYVRAAGK